MNHHVLIAGMAAPPPVPLRRKLLTSVSHYWPADVILAVVLPVCPLNPAHTNTPTAKLYILTSWSVPTHCVAYRPENKLGKLKVHQRLFPTDVLKLFQAAKDRFPVVLSLTDLPSGLSSVCHIQRNAAILESTITFRPPVVCQILVTPLCIKKSFWGLLKRWLKCHSLSWKNDDVDVKVQSLLLDKHLIWKKATRGFVANTGFGFWERLVHCLIPVCPQTTFQPKKPRCACLGFKSKEKASDFGKGGWKVAGFHNGGKPESVQL